MKKQEEEKQCFESYLRRIHVAIENEEYNQSLNLLEKVQLELKQQDDSLQKTEVFSLKAYIFILTKRYLDALELLQLCLKRNKYHLISKKRKALILQKLGKPQQALEEFEKCLWLEPESKSLKNKIKKLTMNSVKSESVSSEGNLTFQEKLSEKQKEEQKQQDTTVEKPKEKVQHNVKFGSFEVIEVGMEESDERDALIKEEINKLSEKKPKKSILKESMSSSAFHSKQKIEEGKKQQLIFNEQEKIESLEHKTKQKTQSKKKAKSVTFKGDTNLLDI